MLHHVHGGGTVIRNHRSGVDMLVDWARELNAVMVSVEYRLAPEVATR
ncbi:alpha/beta hydrolase fold domain-containing protein [Streptomyces griseus]|nr:alpha/beta hydrolase fold domain-containing protein [Streptomyces griseus]